MGIDSAGSSSVLRERNWVQKPGPQDSFEGSRTSEGTVEISDEARAKVAELTDPLLPAGVRAGSLKGVPGTIAQSITSAKSPREALIALGGWSVKPEESQKFDELRMLLRKNI